MLIRNTLFNIAFIFRYATAVKLSKHITRMDLLVQLISSTYSQSGNQIIHTIFI